MTNNIPEGHEINLNSAIIVCLCQPAKFQFASMMSRPHVMKFPLGIHSDKWMLVPNMKKYHQCVPVTLLDVTVTFDSLMSKVLSVHSRLCRGCLCGNSLNLLLLYRICKGTEVIVTLTFNPLATKV